MRRLRLGLALTSLVSSPAWASWVQTGIDAPRMWGGSVRLAPGQTMTISTSSGLFGGDPVLHVWDPGTATQVVMNDDGAGGVDATVTWTNTTGSPRDYSVFLRSWDWTGTGTTDVYQDGVLLAGAVPVAGGHKDMPCGPSYTYEGVLRVGGAPDPFLFGLDNAGNMVAFNDDGGVGLAPKLVGANGTCRIVAGVFVDREPGTVDLYASAPGLTDADGDGLSAAIEAAVGSCDLAFPACYAHNPVDSDRDGLPDGAEVLGVDDPVAPQLLPLWGASPIHKDIFVEVDWSDAFSAQPVMTSDLARVQAHYAAAPAADVVNPDGLDGVRVHFDIGVAPSSPADRTLHGDWGGSNSVPSALEYWNAAAAHRRAVRQGLFRYAKADNGFGGGQAWGDVLGWGVQTWERYPDSLAHEIGHQTGIAHWGHDDWGIANCKPNYLSLMNYAFGDVGFTTGNGYRALDPSALTEVEAIASGVAPNWLRNNPYFHWVNGDAVDWNRDGEMTPMANPVRANPAWATWVSCGTTTNNQYNLSEAAPASTPTLVRFGNRMYAMWVTASGSVRYRHGIVGLDDAQGSCPGGDAIGDVCMTWSPERTLTGAGTALGVDAAAFAGRLYVIVRGTDQILRAVSTASADAAGDLMITDRPQTIPGPRGRFEPEAQVMTVSPRHYGGASEVLAVHWREAGETAYHRATVVAGAGAAWVDRGRVMDAAGVVRRGVRAPALAAMGAGANQQVCGVFTSESEALEAACYERTSDTWVPIPDAFAGLVSVNTAKPGLAYHIPRSATGAPVGGDVTEGYFALSVRRPDGLADLYLSDPLSTAHRPNPNLRFSTLGKVKDEWTATPTGVGAVLYEDANVTALKAVFPWRDAGDGELHFYPLFDGTVSASLQSGNDFHIMERGICLNLRPESWCGPRTSSVHGL